VFPELVYKADISIRNDGYRGAVKAVDLSDEDTGDIFGVVCHIVGNVVTHLRQSVNNYENNVVAIRKRQVRNKVDGDVLLGTFRNRQRL
jgi:hypothetical protein